MQCLCQHLALQLISRFPYLFLLDWFERTCGILCTLNGTRSLPRFDLFTALSRTSIPSPFCTSPKTERDYTTLSKMPGPADATPVFEAQYVHILAVVPCLALSLTFARQETSQSTFLQPSSSCFVSIRASTHHGSYLKWLLRHGGRGFLTLLPGPARPESSRRVLAREEWSEGPERGPQWQTGRLFQR